MHISSHLLITLSWVVAGTSIIIPTLQMKKHSTDKLRLLWVRQSCVQAPGLWFVFWFFFETSMGAWKLWKEGKKDEPKRCETMKEELLRNSKLSNLSRKIRQGKSETIIFFSFIPVRLITCVVPLFIHLLFVHIFPHTIL